MLAGLIISLALAMANPPVAVANADVGQGEPSPTTTHPDVNVNPIQSQTPPGVVPSGTVDRLQLERQQQAAGAAARQGGARSHPEPTCTPRQARRAHCIRPNPSTRSGTSARGESDTTPPVTTP